MITLNIYGNLQQLDAPEDMPIFVMPA